MTSCYCEQQLRYIQRFTEERKLPVVQRVWFVKSLLYKRTRSLNLTIKRSRRGIDYSTQIEVTIHRSSMDQYNERLTAQYKLKTGDCKLSVHASLHDQSQTPLKSHSRMQSVHTIGAMSPQPLHYTRLLHDQSRLPWWGGTHSEHVNVV